MPNWVDYHVHTDNSRDCRTSMADMCAAALGRGVSEIAFTDHFNNHLLDVDAGLYQADRYFEQIENCRRSYPMLTIRAGVEVGEPHRWSRRVLPVLAAYPYDVVLGSLHWCGNDSMFNPNYFRARSPELAYSTYFEELARMIEVGGFDILAHVDLPKRIGYDVYGRFDIADYEKAVRSVWAACIQHGITPEINTKGLRCPVRQLHPAGESLRWYVEMGGKLLTFGSDAHHPDHIADQFASARQMALAAGLTQICQFERRGVVNQIDL